MREEGCSGGEPREGPFNFGGRRSLSGPHALLCEGWGLSYTPHVL